MRALAITVFCFVALLVGGYLYVNNNDLQQEEASRVQVIIKELHSHALQLLAENKAKDALQVLDNMARDPYTPDSLKQLRQNIIATAWTNGQQYFDDGNFKAAAENYNLVRDYAVNRSKIDDTFLEQLADINRKGGLYEEAVKTHRLLISRSVNPLRHWTRMGEIYLFDLDNMPMAQQLLERAIGRIQSNYRRNYGPAYAVVLPPASTPDYHYDAYYAMAYLQLEQEKATEALKNASWAAFLRDTHPEVYLLRGHCYWALSRRSDACQDWQTAQSFGLAEAQALLNERCQ